jgi:glycosyltransferase involved in cell wall biosynthesis
VAVNDRPHVLVLVENLSVPFDRRVWQESLALVEAGHRVTVICPRDARGPAWRERVQGVDIRRFWLPREGEGLPGLAVEYLVALAGMLLLTLRVAARTPIDVVHVCNPPDLLFLCARAARFVRGSAVVFDHHDANPELALQRGFRDGGPMHRLLLFLERLTFRSADVVISTNESYRHLATTRGGKDRGDTFVVRSAPREGLFDLGRVRPELRGDADVLVVYLGVMGPQDGLDVLVETIDRLPRETRDRARFVLIGDGSERDRTECRIAQLGHQDRVHMTGRISDEDLADHLATADLCVNPDPPGPLNDISTMNKVVEYLATGNPIVQFETREGHHSAGDAALYADPGPDGLAAAMCTLINDPLLRREMGERGRQRFRAMLAWERQVPVLLEAYDLALYRRESRRTRVMTAP